VGIQDGTRGALCHEWHSMACEQLHSEASLASEDTQSESLVAWFGSDRLATALYRCSARRRVRNISSQLLQCNGALPVMPSQHFSDDN